MTHIYESDTPRFAAGAFREPVGTVSHFMAVVIGPFVVCEMIRRNRLRLLNNYGHLRHVVKKDVDIIINIGNTRIWTD